MLITMTSCSSALPGSYGVNAFGVGVTYSTPGWSAPVPVVKSEAIIKPTLLVPADSPAASAIQSQHQKAVQRFLSGGARETETLAVPAKAQ